MHYNLYIQSLFAKEIKWNPLKSKRLKKTRGVSFNEILGADLLAVLKHPERDGQQILVFYHKKYVWAVPYVSSGQEIFLKTIYPSRKLLKMYREGLFDAQDTID